MSTNMILSVLKKHSINTAVERGRVIADEIFTLPDLSVHCERIDVTDWTMRDLLIWLGY